MKYLQELKERYSTFYEQEFADLTITKAHEGKGLINKQVNKLYKNKKYIKGYRHFEEVVVRCIAISDRMLKLKYCGWSSEELQNYIMEAVDYYKSGHDNSLADMYGGRGQLTSSDGHRVRSKSELIIDLWLITQNIKHDYEKEIYANGKLAVISDFYLPDYDCYVEYWGLEGDTAYEERKKEKIDFYKLQKLRLISLYNEDLRNLSEVLVKELEKVKK